MPLNERYASTIDVTCSCQGANPGCVNCAGLGLLRRVACRRCGGTGATGGPCVDCRGEGWRELDNPHPGL